MVTTNLPLTDAFLEARRGDFHESLYERSHRFAALIWSGYGTG